VRAKGIAPELMATLPAGAAARTPAETLAGLFWAYDGAKGLGTPPRLYNQIIRQVAEAQGNTVDKNARLFALVNAAMGDAGILAWDEKYRYDLWRPVVGIREHDPSMGPAGSPGNVLDADCDLGWLPLGAPKTNEPGVKNFTPPFPAYPSGHATFGAACFMSVYRFLNATEYKDRTDELDKLCFALTSDEFNGANIDPDGSVRPRHMRKMTLAQAIHENAVSRIYLGVHWRIDAIEGVRLGQKIAENALEKLPPALDQVAEAAARGLVGIKEDLAATLEVSETKPTDAD
jgi:PAP2 superfamily